MVNPETLDVKIIDFGLAEDAPDTVTRSAMEDYDFTASQMSGAAIAYHGTHHTSWVDGDVFSLSSEFGPGLHVTASLPDAIDYAKAYPSQDVVTTSTRIPRREQQGNITAVIIPTIDQLPYVTDIAPKIHDAFVAELRARGETRLATNFKTWARTNLEPQHWWHYLRSKFTDDRMTDLAAIQLGIRDRMVDAGIDAFITQNRNGVFIVNQNIIEHRSIPHYVDGTGSVAEALLYRNKVDDRLVDAVYNPTTRAIQAHNRLNTDTYLQNQAAAAVTKEQQLLLEQMDNLHRQQLSLDTEMLATRQSEAAQMVADMERKTNAVINYEVRNINDLCL
jgi:hypothetical protein